ncbi:hypothetical protein CEXT_50181 [Caerostris extrusa]|uniref:Uncharacterized protein n=1 Tax=Caerostris extrusa TaxID=172846 RepID=A0AAV4SD37_CAEEX|nr:hypothetical protein CEXT_50181 [Caerostris extrusa]
MLDISRSSLQPSILLKDLNLHAYKVELIQELQLTTHSEREFVEWVVVFQVGCHRVSYEVGRGAFDVWGVEKVGKAEGVFIK